MKSNKIYKIKGSRDNILKTKRLSILAAGLILGASAIGGVSYLIASTITLGMQNDIKDKVRHNAYTGNSMLWKNVQRYYNYLINNKAFYSSTSPESGPHKIGGKVAGADSEGSFQWLQDYYAPIFYFIFKDAIIADADQTAYANAIMNPTQMDIASTIDTTNHYSSNILKFFTQMNPDFFNYYANIFANPNSGSASVSTNYNSSWILWGGDSTTPSQVGGSFLGPISVVTGFKTTTSSNPVVTDSIKPTFDGANEKSSMGNDAEIVRIICELAMCIVGTTMNIFGDPNISTDMNTIRNNYINNSNNSSLLNPVSGSNSYFLSTYQSTNRTDLSQRSPYANILTTPETQIGASILDYFASPILVGQSMVIKKGLEMGVGNVNTFSSTQTTEYQSRSNNEMNPSANPINWEEVSVMYSPIAFYGGILDNSFIYNIDRTTGNIVANAPVVAKNNYMAHLNNKLSNYFGFWNANIITSPVSSGQNFKWEYDFGNTSIWQQDIYFNNKVGNPYIDNTNLNTSPNNSYWITPNGEGGDLGQVSFYHSSSVNLTLKVVGGSVSHSLTYNSPYSMIISDSSNNIFVAVPTSFTNSQDKIYNGLRYLYLADSYTLGNSNFNVMGNDTVSITNAWYGIFLMASTVIEDVDGFTAFSSLFDWYM